MTDPTIHSAHTPRSLGWPGYVAWLIIILVAGFIILGNEIPELRGRKATPATSPLQMNLIGKYAVGAAQLKRDSGPELLQQTRDKAETDDDKVDTAILAGELVSKAEALKSLDAIDLVAVYPATAASTRPAVLAAATQAAAAAAVPTAATAPATQASVEDPADESTDPHHAAHVAEQIAVLRQLYRSGVDSLTVEQRAVLLARHDFFGRLALSFGKPDSDPARAAVLHEASTTMIVFGGFMVIVGVLGLVGFVLLVLAIVFFFTGTLKTRYRPQPLLKPVFVEIFAAYLLLFVVGSLLVVKLGGASLGLNATFVLTPIVPLAMGWGVIRGLSWREVLAGLGWFRGRGFFIEVPMGIVGYITGLPVVAAGIGISLFLARFTHAAASHPIQNAFGNASAWQLYGLAAVWAPIVEETFFRGALFNHLRQRWNWLISAPIVALIFAAIHPQGLTFIPALGSIAIVLAGIREWRGTLISSIVAHGLNNATVVTLMLLTM